MNLKIRRINKDGQTRVESSGEIKEVLINEDFLNPGSESISICFKGINSSGIIDLSPKELEMISSSVKNRMHLIKGIKVFKG